MFLQRLLFWSNVRLSINRSGLRWSGRYDAGEHRVIFGSVFGRKDRSRRERDIHTSSVARARLWRQDVVRGVEQTSDVDDAVFIAGKVAIKVCNIIADSLPICWRGFDVSVRDGLNYWGLVLFS
jgi:hypothetical protein